MQILYISDCGIYGEPSPLSFPACSSSTAGFTEICSSFSSLLFEQHPWRGTCVPDNSPWGLWPTRLSPTTLFCFLGRPISRLRVERGPWEPKRTRSRPHSQTRPFVGHQISRFLYFAPPEQNLTHINAISLSILYSKYCGASVCSIITTLS
jgi:hypothetical protein